jgi:predicted  nucleic acid-binding Zn-ribbon protein
VSAEWFFKLKEFDSLSKMRINHLKALKEQEARLESLNIKRQNKLNEVTELKNELLSLQQKYFEAEKKMKSCEEQAQRIKDIGGSEDKINSYIKEAAEIENSLFAQLERTDAIHVEMEDAKTFLNGLEKTYLEIEGEAKEEIQKQTLEISQAEMRMKLIQEELPDDFRRILESTLKKNLAIGPFTRNNNGSCYFCHWKISKSDESEIDMQHQLKTCSQCSRIFLPYGS